MLEGVQYDDTQVQLMKEEVLVVDENDVVIGKTSKEESHLMKNISNGLLHRAFSVFLFDTQDRLLIQRRADCKITFPGLWANTCCSHPLYLEQEVIEEDALGVKRAAIRKLNHELGIPLDRFKPEDFTFLTRIHYKAASEGGIWGEHEIDYILIVKGDVPLNVNINEVSEVRWLSQSELRAFFEAKNKVTPWFQLVVEHFVFDWWQCLENLQPKRDTTIHKWC